MAVEQGADRRRWPIVAGVLLVLVLPALRLDGWLAPGDGIAARIVREAIWWTLALLVLAWVLFVECRPLASIGLKRPGWGTFGWALVGLVALLASAMLGFAVLLPALGLEVNRSAAAAITGLPLWLQLAMFARAGMVEEILYRGYPIERIEALTGSRWLAALVPAAFFIAAHYAFWGGGQLIVVALATLVLTILYLWRRDLVSCIIAHALADTVAFMLARLHG